ncbi:hypothetical protein [Halarcobacter bivalviorum]|uniref:Uncharacterized protein n=1 Tax=Halarcobacter bivalviorum TaxID=663364 RepID=A0AAX2A6E3_9BACT|nr:hypothetical protein [Halarcobacter bivalviorum]AXH13565.1 hypothetical protein ABIV_2599 [Halarcobacter bivalviorum]RXK09829.1 hypothetical protein CRV05_08855 [Halarcobacter bivalviorum]
MNNYVQVSCDLYNMFEEAANNKVDCDITFVKEKEEITVSSKIVDLRNVNNSEFMETADGNVIRLDRIVEFNGKPTADINYYQYQ